MNIKVMIFRDGSFKINTSLDFEDHRELTKEQIKTLNDNNLAIEEIDTKKRTYLISFNQILETTSKIIGVSLLPPKINITKKAKTPRGKLQQNGLFPPPKDNYSGLTPRMKETKESSNNHSLELDIANILRADTKSSITATLLDAIKDKVSPDALVKIGLVIKLHQANPASVLSSIYNSETLFIPLFALLLLKYSQDSMRMCGTF